MQIIYNSQFADATRKPNQTGGHRITLCGYAVTGFAVVGITGNCTVEASDDNFVSTLFSQVVSSDSLIKLPSAITAAKWRITAAAGVSMGQLYIGNHAIVSDPTFPYAFFDNAEADDRETQGGIGYSRLKHVKKSGTFNFHAIQKTDLPVWLAWYEQTNGFRRGFVIANPDNDFPVLVRAPGPFPLTLEGYRNYVGSISMVEML